MRPCVVYSSGKPHPSIKWFKSGHEITGSADFEITFRDGRVALTIPEVFEEDAGLYECQTKNIAGTVNSSAELVVKGRPLSYPCEELFCMGDQTRDKATSTSASFP